MEPRESSQAVDWDIVYADQVKRVYNYFRFRMGSNVDASELTSQTFEKAWRARAQYRRNLAGFSTWLFTIAKHVGTDYLRTTRTLLPIDAAAHVVADDSPEFRAERNSDLSRLAKLTARLTDREQELIALKYGADLSNRSIAEITGLSESNVGTILHRLVQALRKEW